MPPNLLTRAAAFVAAATFAIPAAVSAQERRDSVGVLIVTNASPSNPGTAALSVGAQPALVIGAEPLPSDGRQMYEFRNIAGVARLAGGSVVIADGASRQLRFFDSRGRFLRAVGGPGGGPGEFENLSMFSRLSGDTLVGGDPFTASYFSGDGRFLFRLLSMRPVTGVPAAPRLFVAWLGGGTSVVAPFIRPQPRAGAARWVDSLSLFLVPRENQASAVQLGSVPAFTRAMQGRAAVPLRAGAQGVVASNGREVFYGFGEEYAISVYSASGTLTRIIRRAWIPRSTNDPQLRRDVGDEPLAGTLPAFAQIIADRDGGLWVRAVDIADVTLGSLDGVSRVPSTWSAFDASGRWLADVVMPARFAPKDIGADYVLGIAFDDDGLETIAQYSLVRPQQR